MQYWGGFNNDGSLMNPVDYREAPSRPWYQAIGPAIPLLAAAGAAGASQLFGGAGAGTGAAGNAGWVNGFDLAGGGSLGGSSGAVGGAGAAGADFVGSDWAAGLAGTQNGGLLPTTVDGLTAANTGAAALTGGSNAVNAVRNAATGLLSNGKLLGSVLGGAAGLLSSNNAPDEETVTRKPITDPRVDAAIWGQNGQGGLFNLLMAEATRQPGDALKGAWGVANRYFGK
jgi:hypothetical protein